MIKLNEMINNRKKNSLKKTAEEELIKRKELELEKTETKSVKIGKTIND